MAVIKAFKAVRPAQGFEYKVAAPPYDVLTADEALALAGDNKCSFLHVSRSEIDLAPGTDPYSAEVYEKARDNLNKLLTDGVLVKEQSECLYIYSLVMNGRTQTGIVACTAVDDYISGEIRKHELTRADKEDDRTRHIEYCNANTGPVFMAYRAKVAVRQKLDEWMERNEPLYDFTADDGITHSVYKVDDKEYISAIAEMFAELPLYIADGHHRNASAARVALNRRHPGVKHDQEYDFYLSVIFPDSDLRIMDYNRVVKDLSGSTPEQFLEKLSEKFDISDAADVAEKHSFGLYMCGRWYGLKAKPVVLEGRDAVGLLDVSILQDEVLDKLLGIHDPRSDKRIDFIGGIRGRAELERRVDSGEMALAFALYPTSITDLMTIADQGKIMPPKSTWFEPKLRSGLFVHELD